MFLLFLVLSSRISRSSAVDDTPLEFFDKAYTSIENPVYLMFETSLTGIQCVTRQSGYTIDIQSPKFSWLDADHQPVTNVRMSIMKNGDLHVEKPQTEDSGVYTCELTNEVALSKMAFTRSIIVFKPAVLHLEYDCLYTVQRCDEKLIDRHIKELDSFFCSGAVTDCRFNVTQEYCRQMGTNANINELKVIVKLFVDSKFKDAICNLDCVKSNYMAALQNSVNRKQMDLFKKSSMDIFPEVTGFLFNQDAFQERVVGVCPAGYFPWKEVACLPCGPGYYKDVNFEAEIQKKRKANIAANKDPNKDVNKDECSPCGYFYYQKYFGSVKCVRCPNLGFASTRTSSTIRKCIPFYRTWQGVCIITSVCFLLILATYTGFLHGGFLPCLYKPPPKKKDNKKKEPPKEIPKGKSKSDSKEKLIKKSKETLKVNSKEKAKKFDDRVTDPMELMKLIDDKKKKEARMEDEIQPAPPASPFPFQPVFYPPYNSPYANPYDTMYGGPFQRPPPVLPPVPRSSLQQSRMSVAASDEESQVKSKPEPRHDDGSIPDVIKQRLHPALGWTQAYNTRGFQKT